MEEFCVSSFSEFSPLLSKDEKKDRELRIIQTGFDQIGGVAWDCGRVLAHYFLTQHFYETISKKFQNLHGGSAQISHFLELGSGTGVVGLQLAALG